MTTLKQKFHAVLGSVGLYPPTKAYDAFRYALCTDGQEDTVRDILKKYPDAVSWEKRDDMQPLAYAMWQRQLGVCGILIQHDPSILADKDKHGVTPLRHEMSRDNADNMEFLIAHGANVQERTAQEGNLLHDAAMHTLYTKSIAILVKHGVNPLEKNRNGDTPLMIAAEMSAAAFSAFRNHDPNLAQRDAKGRTLMMRAAMRNRGVNVIAQLIAAGAGLEEKCPAGKTALDYALDNSKTSTAADLISRGAVFDKDDKRIARMISWEDEFGDSSLKYEVEQRVEADAERERLRQQQEAAEEALRAADEIARITEGTRDHIAVRPIRLKF